MSITLAFSLYLFGMMKIKCSLIKKKVRVVFTPSMTSIDRPLMPSSDVTTPLLYFMQKVKHDFQLAKKEILSGTRFSKVPITFRILNQKFKSK